MMEQITQMRLKGLKPKEIARKLRISVITVYRMSDTIKRK
jgi:hypothetical protein